MCQGARRKTAKQKKDLGLPQTVGKSKLLFSAYRCLAKILLESEDPEHVAAHTFLVFDWNLVSWFEYVVGAKVDLVSLKEDSLIVDMSVTKTD